MLPEVDRPAHRFGHEHDIGTYYVVAFDDVGAAVECCDRLVPYTIPRGAVRRGADRAVVWFHVPARATRSTRGGCYLFVSAGLLDALAEVAPHQEPVAALEWDALPPTAVLIFGEDTLPARDAIRTEERTPPYFDRVVERPIERDARPLLDRRSSVRGQREPAERLTPR